MPSKVRQAEATDARAERVMRVERSCMVAIGWVEVVECIGRELGCLAGKEVSGCAIQAMAVAVLVAGSLERLRREQSVPSTFA